MGKLCHNCRRPIKGGWRTGFAKPCDCAVERKKKSTEIDDSDANNSEENNELSADSDEDDVPPLKKTSLKAGPKGRPLNSKKRVAKEN